MELYVNNYLKIIKSDKYSMLILCASLLGIIIAVLNNVNGSNYFDNFYYILTNSWFIFFLIIAFGLNILSINTYVVNYYHINLRKQSFSDHDKMVLKYNMLLFCGILILVCIGALFYSDFDFSINNSHNYYMSQLIYILFDLIKLFVFVYYFSDILFAFLKKYNNNLVFVLYILFDILLLLIPSLVVIVDVKNTLSIPLFIGYCFQKIEYSNFMLEIFSCTVHLIIIEIISLVCIKKVVKDGVV